MPELAVPKERQPSVWKYVGYTVVGLLLVNGFSTQIAGGTDDPVLAFGVVAAAGIANVALLFVMVESLVQEWFSAAEIVEE